MILDLGCLPQAHYIDDSGRRCLRNTEVNATGIEITLLYENIEVFIVMIMTSALLA